MQAYNYAHRRMGMTVQGDRRKFRREGADQRKEALVRATLGLIAEEGVRGATVRAIAERAEVTQGLIRHYFSTKEDLVLAAYTQHMDALTEQTFAKAEGATPRARLAALVVASVTPPVADAGSVALWAGFLTQVRQDARMQEVHARSYHGFRDRLEALIAEVLAQDGRAADSRDCRPLAIACNAVIDGLWLEGGALADAFEEGELAAIAVQSVGAILGMNLTGTEAQE